MTYFNILRGINYQKLDPSNMHISHRYICHTYISICTLELQKKNIPILKAIGGVIRTQGATCISSILQKMSKFNSWYFRKNEQKSESKQYALINVQLNWKTKIFLIMKTVGEVF